MTRSPDRLYELLPVVHRMRDARHDYPLRALLRLIDEQVGVLEEDIARMYDNWFIETCDDWVVPYIGELIGYDGGSSGAAHGRAAGLPLARAEVANTLGFRRRKGTLALLETLATQAAGWPARALECHTLLGWRQHTRHARPNRGRSVDLRDGDALDLLDGPFDAAAHAVDVRRMGSRHRPGRYNIEGVAVFVWRLRAYPVTHAPAYRVESVGPHCFTFSVLGHDSPLHVKAVPEVDGSGIAGELNLPVPIRRRLLERRLSLRPLKTAASEALYGMGKSLVVFAPGWPGSDAAHGHVVPAASVVAADLSEWRYRPARGQVAVDPVRGRIAFPPGQAPRQGVWVSYHHAFSDDIGGGEYPRPMLQPERSALYPVSKDKPGAGTFDSIGAALRQWRQDQEALGDEPAGADEGAHWRGEKERLRAAVIEIRDSAAYSEPIAIVLGPGESLQLRAANRTRPVIRLLDFSAEGVDGFTVSGGRASRFVLDGIVVTGRGMRIDGPERGDPHAAARGDLCDVRLRHVTLVPGWSLDCDCTPARPGEASLELRHTGARILIEHSILGPIAVAADEVATDPVAICVSDSIIDATDMAATAIGGATRPLAFARLSVVRSTVLGSVNTHALALGEDAIFMGGVTVARRQQGCMRYCYVPPDSRTPRRYRCQPETAEAAAVEALRAAAAASGTVPGEAGLAEASERERERVRPRFTSTRYGNPAYCQLACDCADEIRRGAHDESEMGAFHDMYQPQREARLRARLEEYVPAGMTAGILFAN